jgi:N-methylhydantoinase B/oxoprolinase/acetone carboxylase alpha subunit
VMEGRAPVLFEEKRLLPDSGGPGTYRGGLGQRVRVRALSDEPIDFIVGTVDRIDHPPFGLAGGEAGGGGRLEIDSVPVDRRVPHKMELGQVLTACMPGGGGFGPASRRDRRALERDIALGYVTPEAARERYRQAPEA